MAHRSRPYCHRIVRVHGIPRLRTPLTRTLWPWAHCSQRSGVGWAYNSSRVEVCGCGSPLRAAREQQQSTENRAQRTMAGGLRAA
eukprot:scaffold105891_cov37-Tisochrysis_lutea.AAC.5